MYFSFHWSFELCRSCPVKFPNIQLLRIQFCSASCIIYLNLVSKNGKKLSLSLFKNIVCEASLCMTCVKVINLKLWMFRQIKFDHGKRIFLFFRLNMSLEIGLKSRMIILNYFIDLSLYLEGKAIFRP